MNIKVEFVLFSRKFPIDSVYEIIGITGYKNITKKTTFNTLSNGEYIKEDEYSITYSAETTDTVDVDVAISRMYNMLIGHKSNIKKCIDSYGLTAKFYIVINLSDNPIIEISNKFISLASDLNADISFDTYLDYDDAERSIKN